MAKYKVTGKVSSPLGTVTASKNVEAANEKEAQSKAQEIWQISYGEILDSDGKIEEIIVTEK